jgi:general secretion pathway protein H
MAMKKPQQDVTSGGRDAGFSLLEIMIALVILALAVGVMGVGFARSSAGYRFDAAAQDLALSLREANARALRSGREIAVVIDVDGRHYQLQQDQPVALPDGAGVRVVSGGQVMNATRRPAIIFYPNGGSSGGTITLTEQDRSAAVSVDWLTGAVGITSGGADAPAA